MADQQQEKGSVIMKHPVAKTRNGITITVDLIHSAAAMHISRSPHLLTMAKELLATERVSGETVDLEYDIGRIAGTTPVVETSSKDIIFYAKQLHDDTFTRFTKNAKAVATQFVTIQLVRSEDGTYELTNIMIGRLVPVRPGQPGETPEGKTFWENHAFVLEGIPVQIRTVTRTNPYGDDEVDEQAKSGEDTTPATETPEPTAST